jgi:hypothetical protein
MVERQVGSMIRGGAAEAMRRQSRGCRLAVCILSVVVQAARANVLTPPTNPLEESPERRIGRFRIGAYWAQWAVPSYRSGGATVHRNTEASPAITGDYALTNRVALGGWWNRIRGADDQSGRPDLPRRLGEFDFNAWDAHATYYLRNTPTEGRSRPAQEWSLQVGFTTLDQVLKPIPSLGNETAHTYHSVNYWITLVQRVGGRSREPQGHAVRLYGSVGYFPSRRFGRSNLIFGGSVGLSRHLDLSGSVWLNDLEHLNLRTTVGLVGSF